MAKNIQYLDYGSIEKVLEAIEGHALNKGDGIIGLQATLNRV